MGAGAAYILQTPLTQLDAGGVAFQALGAVGILAVVIAGWTTSNPTIYRAGLAFQSLNPKWSREKVTLTVGIITAIIACSPFVFSQLLGFLGIMAVIMAPIGAIIFAEHYVFKGMGIARYWRMSRGDKLNMPAAITWASTALFAYVLGSVFGIHIFFLFIPTWIAALIVYPLLSSFMGAKAVDGTVLDEMERVEADRKAAEAKALMSLQAQPGHKRSVLETGLLIVAALALVVCFYLGFKASGNTESFGFKSSIIWPTIIYFIAATVLVFLHKDKSESAA